MTETGDIEPGRNMFFAELYGYPENDNFDYLTYNIEYLPVAGRYSRAQLQLSLHLAKNAQQVDNEITADTSRTRFSATFEYEFSDYLEFDIYDEDGNWAGCGGISEDALPNWLTDNDGGDCYVVIQLEYDHQYTMESKDFSEHEIEQRRQRTQEEYDNWNTDSN
ncbi:hypothetical protein [Halorussus halophilus]|uniref:hypothetical protein n=1 Tax=Halorussus halophilus TaxID=2650975 RepID=UPI001300DB03|nr:hypothetical protein [Halorussus halophilus]